MAGTKRKTESANAIHDSRVTTKLGDVSGKKRKLTPPTNLAARPKPLAESETTDDSGSVGGVSIFSSEEEAAAFGPSAQERGEAEWDSDPIIESDTTEHSGEDDGVSWPSDGEEDKPLPSAPAKDTGSKADIHGGKARHARTVEGASLPNGHDAGKQKPLDHGPIKADRLIAQADNTDVPNSSRGSHAKQKAVAQDRKAAKPNADSIARTKKLWERLRRKSHVPLEERKRLVAELFGIITGHIKEFVLKHDSVRVVQTALKYANIDQRKMIATELKGEYRSLAESRYAKFLIGKLLVPGDGYIRDMIVPELCGHVRRMIKHPEASWILDDIYRGAATSEQQAILLREWYGAEFAIFKTKEGGGITADLSTILTKQPEKRKPIMHALHDLINQCIQKKATGFTMLHDAMLQYYLNLQPGSTEATEFVELLKGDEEGDLLKNLAFTKSGARIVCLALAYSNAKDRKIILRTYKETIRALAFDLHGYQVLLAAYDVVDDTVLIAKSIFSELLGKDHSSEQSQQNLLTAATHLNARIPLLYPFAGQSKSLLSFDDQKLLSEIHAIRTGTSKKDPGVRRKELVSSLSAPLLSFIEKNTRSLMTSNFGCHFMTEVLLGSVGDRTPALNSTAKIAVENSGVGSELHSSDFGRMLKFLVQGGRYNQKAKTLEFSEPPLQFHDILYPNIKDSVVDWAASGNAFVIVALTEAKGFSFADELIRKLRKGKSRISEAAGAGNRGSQLLLDKIK